MTETVKNIATQNAVQTAMKSALGSKTSTFDEAKFNSVFEQLENNADGKSEYSTDEFYKQLCESYGINPNDLGEKNDLLDFVNELASMDGDSVITLADKGLFEAKTKIQEATSKIYEAGNVKNKFKDKNEEYLDNLLGNLTDVFAITNKGVSATKFYEKVCEIIGTTPDELGYDNELYDLINEMAFSDGNNEDALFTLSDLEGFAIEAPLSYPKIGKDGKIDNSKSEETHQEAKPKEQTTPEVAAQTSSVVDSSRFSIKDVENKTPQEVKNVYRSAYSFEASGDKAYIANNPDEFMQYARVGSNTINLVINRVLDSDNEKYKDIQYARTQLMNMCNGNTDLLVEQLQTYLNSHKNSDIMKIVYGLIIGQDIRV